MDILVDIIKQFYQYPLLVLLTFFWKQIWLASSGLVSLMFNDLPRISKKWNTTMTHTSSFGVKTILNEVATAKQFGRIIFGKIEYYKNNKSYNFNFKAELKKHTLYGTFKRSDSTKATGTGVFQLIINGNEDVMQGYTSWHASDTDVIESAIYTWTKQ